jgi:hypothetical protein
MSLSTKRLGAAALAASLMFAGAFEAIAQQKPATPPAAPAQAAPPAQPHLRADFVCLPTDR